MDRELLVLLAITFLSVFFRWLLAVGPALPDDVVYAGQLKGILRGAFPVISDFGQNEYRPAFQFPVAASIWLLGWTARGLVLYPVITGGFIPLLTALWLRRNLPRGSQAPILCAIILASYPVLFVDSLMLVNEMPLIFWCLLCVNLSGSVYSRLTNPPPTGSGPIARIGFPVLAGTTFAVAYQVKVSAIPILGIWLTTEILLQVARRGWPERKRWTVLAVASVAYLLPTLGVQLFYRAKTGHIFGNIVGEVRMYHQLIPEEYYSGQLRLHDILSYYFYHLFLPFGPEGFRALLHGVWVWVTLGLGVIAAVFWRWLPAPQRAMAFVFLISATSLFLFLEFWPQQLKPYYLPINFPPRPWRYTDVLGPPVAACAALFLTLPGVFDRWFMGFLRGCVFCACFGISGYCLVVRYYVCEDNTADYRRAAQAGTTWLGPYLKLDQIMDPDASGQLTEAFFWPDHTRFKPFQTRFLDLRNSPQACIWTGGARREGMGADAAWSADEIEILGGDAVLIHTFDGFRRPWRTRLLQLWLFRPTKPVSHEHPPQH
jgi:hypothetical protein